MHFRPHMVCAHVFAIIGAGALARAVLETVAAEPGWTCGCILARSPVAAASLAGLPAVGDVAGLLATRPGIVAECAGHQAVAEFVPAVLAAGIDVVVASVGALMDDGLRERIVAAARAGGARAIVPAGALGGLDALAALRLGGLKRVLYRGAKPPGAWPAQLLSGRSADDAQMIFSGSARDAALRFPRNANVAAAVALAGLGPDLTRVELMSDPSLSVNRHAVEADGRGGRLRVTIDAEPLPDQPRTSALAALSIAASLITRTGAVVL